MIGIDTNILARYYIQDESDTEAQNQHLAAKIFLNLNKNYLFAKPLCWNLNG